VRNPAFSERGLSSRADGFSLDDAVAGCDLYPPSNFADVHAAAASSNEPIARCESCLEMSR